MGGPCERICHKTGLCMFLDWEDWGKCSTSCGKGVQKRIRKLAVVKDDADLSARLASLQQGHVQEVVIAFAAGCLSITAFFGAARLIRNTRAASASPRLVTAE